MKNRPYYRGCLLTLCSVLLLPAVGGELALGEKWQLPTVAPAATYGSVTINRVTRGGKVKSVVFSHWIHRRKFTCRVCHSELEFALKANGTEITEAANRSGKFCGACHNGFASFSLDGNCERCHSGGIDPGKKRAAELANLPRSGFADVIDWEKAEEQGLIKPADHLKRKSKEITFDKTFMLKAEWNYVPPAVFSHKTHGRQLECGSCHPDIFNIKKKGTKDFTMSSMLQGEFCGSCHLNVAFPLNHCKRCHPGMTMW